MLITNLRIDFNLKDTVFPKMIDIISLVPMDLIWAYGAIRKTISSIVSPTELVQEDCH